MTAAPSGAEGAGATVPAQWWRPLGRGDRRALLAFMVFPVLVFAVPAAFGHPAIAQDNFIQNYPLRVLTGQQLRSGHLPLLNPLANSGTPLLGGMNAGSFYPATLLFVFLPGLVAWVANLVIVYATAAIGLYALGRWLRLGVLASALGAVAYAYAGSMMGQMVHLGVIEGYSLLPWLVLALLALGRAAMDGTKTRSERLRAMTVPMLGVAAVWGLCCLSGEPRAFAEAELVTAVVAVVELLFHVGAASWRRRAAFLAATCLGVVWGVVIGLAQLLPGWNFITQSERANVGYAFFGSGSLVVRWSALFFDQDLFGSNGALGTPRYFAGYNLAEVTGYVGILALVAVFAYLAQLTRRGWQGEQRPFAIFMVLVVIGVLATWGSFTPLGHLFHALPLFGRTRLQSRNVVVADLGAAVLLAWFCDRLFARRFSEASLLGRRRWIALAPAVAAGALALVTLAVAKPVERFFGVVETNAEAVRAAGPLLVHLALAVGAVLLLTVGLARPHLRRWLVVLFVADILIFNVLSDVGFATGSTPNIPTRASVVGVLGTTGRYALIDAGQTDFGEFESLGIPNLNVFTGLPSVQGYGSLEDERYDAVTGTHELATLNACRLADGNFGDLQLDTVVISASSLTFTPHTPSPAPVCSAPLTTRSVSRYFGALLPLQRITMHLVAPLPTVTLRLLNGVGKPMGAAITQRGQPREVFNIPPGPPAAGFEVTAPNGVTFVGATVRYAHGARSRTLNVETGYQQALAGGSWRLVETAKDYAVFRATVPPPAQYLQTGAAAGTISNVHTASWGDAWMTVTTTLGANLVRTEAWLAGWRATLTNLQTGRTITVPIQRFDLVQQVGVPPGRWLVHFHYHAPYLELGLILSFAALGLFIAALIAWWWWRRRAAATSATATV